MKKTTVKKIAAWTAGVVCALLAIIAIVVNFVLTPEMLTPIVLQYANEYVDGDVQIDEVEAVFFRTFPFAGVSLKGATIVSNAFHPDPEDTVRTLRDTLLMADEIRVGVDVGRYLALNELVIGRIYLNSATVRLSIDETGRANYDIFSSESDTTEVADDDTTSLDISFRRIKIENSNIVYGDMQQKTFAAVRKLDFLARGHMSLDELSVKVEMQDSATYLALDGTRYLKAMPLGIDGRIEADLTNGNYDLEKTSVTISKTELDVDGSVQTDSTGLVFDLAFGLSTPNAAQIFEYLPKSLIQKEIDVSKGSVELAGTFVGTMNEQEMPVFTCGMTIDGIRAQYEDMPMGIDDLTAEFNAMVDGKQPKESYANFDLFHFKGGESEVEATVKVSELLGDPLVDCSVTSHLDLASLTDVFPIENTTMSGLVDANLNANFRLSDIESLSFGKFTLNGNLRVDSLQIDNDTLGIHLTNDASLTFTGKDTLQIAAAINRLRFIAPDTRVFLSNFKASAATEMQPDTTKLPLMRATASARHLFLRIDSTRLFFKKLEVAPLISHSSIDPKKPYLEVALKSDSIFSNFYGTRGLTDGLDTWASLELIDTTWVPNAYADIKMVRVATPSYRLPFELDDARVTMADRLITLEKSQIRVGHTRAQVTGSVKNLIKALREKTRLRTDLTINADTLHLTELMAAIVEEEATDSTATTVATTSTALETDSAFTVTVAQTADTLTIDSIHPRVFALPPKLRVEFNLAANRVIWNKLELEEVESQVQIRRQALHMTDFKFKQGDSRALMTVAYKARPDDNMADLKFFAVWSRADLQKLISGLDLDTVMPILEPIKGEVDAHIGVELELDSLLNFDLNNARAALHLSASQLTVLDGENLAKIAKPLMFKNKQENVIDTISMNVLVDSGKVELLPFIARIDRYRLIIGGGQDFDNNLNYHVSVIKSPLPFKAGVTITGTPDDIDIDITTAKLKKYDDEEKQLQNDTASLRVRNSILLGTYTLSGLEPPEFLKSMPMSE